MTEERPGKQHGRRVAVAWLAGMLALSLLAGSGIAGASNPLTGRAARRRAGGTLTVLESFLSWTNGLDPLTNPRAAEDQTLEDAIFGELFELGPKGTVVDDLAAGYQLTDRGRILAIEIRKGVTFSDGTPFDAAAVAFNLRRDLTAPCPCRPDWSVASITTPSRYRVVIRLRKPDGAIVDQFQDSVVNWMVSPRALRKAGGVGFAQTPVGAGPFEVAANVTDARLVLRRNPHYWQKGRPSLKGLVFMVTHGDQLALDDLRAGTAQAYEAMSTPALVKGFTSAGFTATLEPSTSPLFLALNRSSAPFDRRSARKAVYEATDAALLDKVLNGDAVPVTESFTGPTGRFYEPKVAGYPAYDLARAKRLVRELGGLSFTLVVPPFQAQELGAALQSLYERAGMKVRLAESGTAHWGVAVSRLGSFDPAGASGLASVEAPGLASLVAAGEATVGEVARARVYAEVARLFARQALGPFLYPPALWSIAAKGVAGPGLTTELPISGFSPAILWQDVSMRSRP